MSLNVWRFQVFFVIANPEVYKSPNSDCYIVFGEVDHPRDVLTYFFSPDPLTLCRLRSKTKVPQDWEDSVDQDSQEQAWVEEPATVAFRWLISPVLVPVERLVGRNQKVPPPPPIPLMMNQSTKLVLIPRISNWSCNRCEFLFAECSAMGQIWLNFGVISSPCPG